MSNDKIQGLRVHSMPPKLPVSNLSNRKSKSAYMIALVRRQNFISLGAKPIQGGVSYYIPRNHVYDGSPFNETCGILGLRANFYHHLNNPACAVFRKIKESPLLQNVEDALNVTAKKIAPPLSKFDSFLRAQNDDILILLNVEPKGTGIFTRIYPHPQITLPGGTMEDGDGDCFQACAFREFKEETGFDISRCSSIIHNETMQQLRHKYQSTNSHFTYNATYPERMHTSMYFLCLAEWHMPPGLGQQPR